MNWKKILGFAVGSGLLGGITPYVQSFTSGHPMPLTFGTVGVPMLITLVSTLAGLFTHRPQDTPPK